MGGGIDCKDRAMLANEFDGVPARTRTLALRKLLSTPQLQPHPSNWLFVMVLNNSEKNDILNIRVPTAGTCNSKT